MKFSISNIRLSFLCIAWVAALVQVVSGTPSTNAQSINFSNIGVINLGVFAFVGFTTLTVSRLRRDSMLILALLIFVCYVTFMFQRCYVSLVFVVHVFVFICFILLGKADRA